MIPVYTDLFPYYSFDATRYLLVNGIAILNIKGKEKYVIFAQENNFCWRPTSRTPVDAMIKVSQKCGNAFICF